MPSKEVQQRIPRSSRKRVIYTTLGLKNWKDPTYLHARSGHFGTYLGSISEAVSGSNSTLLFYSNYWALNFFKHVKCISSRFPLDFNVGVG